MLHLITLKDWTGKQVTEVLGLARQVKAAPGDFENALHRKVLVMIFEKPSLRTRVSFETGMSKMGGHAIYYDMSTSPLGAGKETVHDTAKTLGRYADLIMARVFEHEKIEELARYAGIPVINGLTNSSHPCQILADLLTVHEHKGALKGITLAYLGDGNNNVTHSLMYGCALTGMNIRVGCPDGDAFRPDPEVERESAALGKETGAEVTVTHSANEAADGADVVYTDSWMSYHIPKDQLDARVSTLRPYQVNEELMKQAAPEAIFMNCLPALRGYEQTAGVIDGTQSVVFDQAENRLHAQNAVMLTLLGAVGK